MKQVVIVGGCGHVGLPLALVLADYGFQVSALDISDIAVAKINSGGMPFEENGAEDVLARVLANKRFSATTDFSVIRDAHVVIVVIGTPVDEHLNPDPNEVIRAIYSCIPHMNSNQLIILRSTVYPGVTKKVERILEDSGIEAEVTFCPERILEGHAMRELLELPQIIGASSESAGLRAAQFFQSLGIETILTSPEEAELAKLFTNVWRYVKFAAANQFWIMSNEVGLDYAKIRSAITYKYPRASDLPSAGFAAGPCLFKDTMQLAAFSNNNFALGHSAMLVNEGLPLYIVSQLEKRYNLFDLEIGILGAAFKGESDDPRSSLSYKLLKILQFKSKKVRLSDPYVKTDSRLSSLEETLDESDLLIIATPHEIYKHIETSKPVIDIWNILGNGTVIP